MLKMTEGFGQIAFGVQVLSLDRLRLLSIRLACVMSASPNLEELIVCMRNASNPREQRVAAIQKMAW